jgi:hypothetical protein
LVHALDLFSVNGEFTGFEDGGLNEDEVGVVDELSEQPDEGLLELIIALGRDIVVLQVLLSVEGDLLGLHLSVLHVNFVADEDDGDVFTYSHQILIPLGHILVGNSAADVEHDDSGVSTNTKGEKRVIKTQIQLNLKTY